MTGKDAVQFWKFMAAVMLPALVAGLLLPVMKGYETGLAAIWFVVTLLGIGYSVDGLRGAKDLLHGTMSAWALMVTVGLLVGLLAAAKFAHSL